MVDHTKQCERSNRSVQGEREPEEISRTVEPSAPNSVAQQPIDEPQEISVKDSVSHEARTERDQPESSLIEANIAVELAMEGIAKLDDAGRYLFVNQRYAGLLGYRPDELVGQSWEITVYPDDRPSVMTAFATMLQMGKAEAEIRGIRRDGSVVYKHAVLVKQDSSGRKIHGHLCFVWDVTERKRMEDLQDAEKQVLELVAKGETLEKVLEFVCRAVESLASPMLCSVMLADADGMHLSLATAPNLPGEYNRAITKVPIGPMVGSCGSAAYFRTHAIAVDIATDPLWKDYASVALSNRLKACWSLPIIGSTDRLLGTLAVYHSDPREPRPTDVKILERVCRIVTIAIEHARMTEALRESEARFDAFMRYSPAATCIKDRDGRYLYANPQFETLSGCSRKDLTAKTVFDFLPPEIATKISQQDKAVLRSGQTLETEEALPGPDGRLQYWLINKFPLGMGQRELLGGVAINITERKLLEQASQHQANRLRLAMDIAGIATWEWDIRANKIIWSDNYEQVKRLPPGSFDGTFEAYQRLVHPEDLPRLLDDIQCALDGQKPYHTVHRIVPTTGEVQWIEGNASIYRDELGRPVRMVGTARNITEQKCMEQVLRLNEERYARATAVGRVGVWELDVQTGIYYGDRNLKAMFGYQPDELSSDPVAWLNLVYPDDRAIATAHWQEIVDRKTEEYNYELRMVRKDGTVIWTDVRGHAVRTPDGRLTHLIGATVDITDRKKAEADLRRTKFAMDQAVDAVYWIDPQARILYTNEAATAMLGYTADEFLNMTVHDLNPDFPAEVWPGWWKETREKKVISLETVHLTKDGRRIPIDIRVSFLAYGGQEFHCAFVRDISQRKAVEEAAHRSLTLLQSVLHTTPIRVFWKDRESRFLGCNQNCALDAGCTDTQEIVGKTDDDLIWHNQAALYQADDRLVMESGLPKLDFEEPGTTPDGKPIWLRTSKVPLRDEQGRVIGVLGVYEDITARKRMDGALRESQERFELAVSATADGIWDWNILTGKQYWSDHHLELFGLTPGQFTPTYELWLSLLHPDDVELVHQATCRHLETRAPYDVEVRVRMKDGSYRWFRDRGQAIWDDAGRPVRMVGSITDVTARRQAEEAIWRANAELEQRVVERTKELATANRALELEIVERKRVEDRLQRTQYAVDHAADQIFVVDSNGRFVDVNESACRRLGYSKEELMTMSVMDIDPDFPREAWDSCWAALTTERQLRIETRHRSKSGEIYPVEVVANYLCHNGQELDCAIVRDVSERKRIEERLQRTQYAVDHAVDQVFFVDSKGKLIDVNETACHRLGFSKEELLQKSVVDIDPDLSHEEWAQHWSDFLSAKQFRVERRHRAKSGEIYPVEVTGHYQMSGGEEIEFVTVRDIHDRKQAEEVVRESQLRYKLVTEATFDAIALHDSDILIEVNSGLERMFGYEPGELLGRSILDLIADESRDAVQRNMHNGVTGPYEAVGRRKDGTTFPGELVVRPYRYHGKEVRLVAGRDITERKQLDLQLSRHAEELERQVEERTSEIAKLEAQRAQTEKLAAVGQMAAAVAHEINNPIAGIRNAFTLVKQAVDPTHPHYEFVGMIDREIARVASIVQNMYQLYRKEPSKAEPVNLPLLLRDLEAVFAKRLSQSSLRMVVTQAPLRARLLVPQSDLLQVMMNLIQNALDSSRAGGTITVNVRQDQDLVRISVSDEGSGIPQDVLPHIFDPFFTTKTEKGQKGMGLGLSVSQSLVMAMGGRIEVQTQEGAGSTFSIILPEPTDVSRASVQRNIFQEVLTHET